MRTVPPSAGFSRGPLAATSIVSLPASPRSGTSSPRTAASAVPDALASTAGFSPEPSNTPRRRRSIPSPTAWTSSTVTRAPANRTWTSPSLRRRSARSRASRRSRVSTTSPEGFSPAFAGSVTRPRPATAPPAPSGSASGVKSRSVARSATSASTSSDAGVADRSPRAATVTLSGTVIFPSTTPAVMRRARRGSAPAGIGCPKKVAFASDADRFRSGFSSEPEPETSNERRPWISWESSRTLWIADSGIPSPAARTSKVFSLKARLARPPAAPPSSSARTSSKLTCPGVRPRRPVMRSTFWPHTTASSITATPSPETASGGFPESGKLPVTRPVIG